MLDPTGVTTTTKTPSQISHNETSKKEKVGRKRKEKVGRNTHTHTHLASERRTSAQGASTEPPEGFSVSPEPGMRNDEPSQGAGTKGVGMEG